MSQQPPRATATPSSATLGRTIKAVAWSFVGIRKKSESQEDLARVNPFHVIGIGIAGVAILVVALVLLVNFVVAK